MADWTTPVTDRSTPDDLFLSINRINENIQYISDYLDDSGIASSVVTNYLWARSDVPLLTELDVVFASLISLRNSLMGFYLPVNTFDLIGYWQVNQVENIILLLYNSMNSIIYNLENFMRCGMNYCGDGGLI